MDFLHCYLPCEERVLEKVAVVSIASGKCVSQACESPMSSKTLDRDCKSKLDFGSVTGWSLLAAQGEDITDSHSVLQSTVSAVSSSGADGS